MAVHRLHQRGHMLGRGVLADAVAQVEDVGGTGAACPGRACQSCPAPWPLRFAIAPVAQTARWGRYCLAGPCRGHFPRRPPARGPCARFTVQSRPSTSQSSAFMSCSHRPPPLVNTMRGITLPSAPMALELGQHARGVGQAELLERAIGQHAAPAVKNHHGLGARVDLGVQVGGHRVGVDGQHAVHQVGAAVQHGFDQAVVVASPCLRPCSRPASRGCR